MPTFTITNCKGVQYEILYDEEDTELLAQYTWHVSDTGYAMAHDRRPDRSKYHIRMHRRIMEASEGMEIDHINGNSLDNRKENLRVCTHAENGRNQKKPSNNTSGYKGVSLYKPTNRFRADIQLNGKQNHLGYFKTALEAAEAYNEAAKRLFGDFMRDLTHD